MTLIQLFTAIANAIRGKTGSSSSIPAENFPQEIAGITTGKLTNAEYEEADDDLDDILENTTVPSGTISITSNGEYDVTNYVGANVNVVSLYNAKIDTTKTYTENYGICSIITDIGLLDTSNMTNMKNMFNGFFELKEVPLLNTSNVINMTSMFARCSSLITIPLIDTSNVTDMSNMYIFCSSLTSIPILDTSKVTNMYGMYSYCNSLSNDSLNNVLAMCVGASAYSGTKTLKYIGLSSTQATTCTGLSNWSACQSAGWTTGY